MDLDRDPEYEDIFNIYLNLLTKQNFQIFYTKTWWNIQRSENFHNLSFFNSSDLDFESKVSLFACLADILLDPWIRIILRIRFKEA